ncbi:hypothetical protein [Aliiroseovarius sp. YM-037]|uniref:hypothetical protein n=1 Tax=Aliiroseovarius sp. YM-037 TaxID=3341728 RepID=UPI003A7FE7FF
MFNISLRHSALPIALFVFTLMALTKMRPPNLWAHTQFLLSYDVGTVRRSLIGQGLAWVFESGLMQSTIFALAAVLTLSGAAAMVLFMARALARLDGGAEVLLVFVTSVGMVTFLCNTGYLEGALALVGVAALILPVRGALPLIAKCVLCIVGVLIHDIMLPTFALLVGLQLFLSRDELPVASRIALGALPVALTAAVLTALFLLSPDAAESYDTVFATVTDRALDFPTRKGAVEAVMSYGPGMEPAYDSVWGSDLYRFELIYISWIGVAITLWLLVAAARLISHRPMLDRLALVAAGLGPLSLLLVAFDVSRLLGVAILHAFLVIAVVLLIDESARVKLRSVFTQQAIVLLLIVNVVVGFRPLNGYPEFGDDFPGAVMELPLWWNMPPSGGRLTQNPGE